MSTCSYRIAVRYWQAGMMLMQGQWALCWKKTVKKSAFLTSTQIVCSAKASRELKHVSSPGFLLNIADFMN